MSERQYASHVGLSRGAIQKAKTSGRLVLHADGSIDARASDARRASMTDPSKQHRDGAETKLKPVPDAALSAVGDTLRESGIAPSPAGGGTTFLQAKTANEVLNAGSTLFAAGKRVDLTLLKELSLMTAKPFLYVFNADEAVLTDEAKRAELLAAVAPADAVFLDAKVEHELLELDEESARELLESVGQSEPGLHALARAGFHTLGLQTYLTAGPKEARAWTIHRGDTAPQAAGVIHTDFERGFIKAEIVSFDDLMAARSMAAAKAAGRGRMEGKDYVMADGDVVEFRFNV